MFMGDTTSQGKNGSSNRRRSKSSTCGPRDTYRLTTHPVNKPNEIVENDKRVLRGGVLFAMIVIASRENGSVWKNASYVSPLFSCLRRYRGLCTYPSRSQTFESYMSSENNLS